MTELEKLMEQKREIEKQIKMLKDSAITCGNVQYATKSYSTGKIEYRINVKRTRDYLGKKQIVWSAIVNENSEADCKMQFTKILADMKDLENCLGSIGKVTNDGSSK